VQKDFETFIGQGEQAQGGSRKLTKEEGIVCMWEEKKEEDLCEEVLSSYVWRGAHRKGVCKD
jgi:hypothetical protein